MKEAQCLLNEQTSGGLAYYDSLCDRGPHSSPALKMCGFVSSCWTACSTPVSQPFTCSPPALCRGRSVINTLVLQMETRPGKCPAPTDSCHAMPILRAGAQPLRRAGCELCIPAPQPLASPVSHPWNKGRLMWPPLATAPWFLGHGQCKAQLWLYWSCAHSTIPALSPGQRGL